MEANWETFGLPETATEQIKGACRDLRETADGQASGALTASILLYGPGTEKARIARAMADDSNVAFVVAGLADLRGGFIGQSSMRVREVFTRARSVAPCILFIDEIDSAAARRGPLKADISSQEIVTEMLQQLSGVQKGAGRLTVVAASNRPEDIDPAVRSRFTVQIEIPA